MSDSLRDPWIRDYFLDVAEMYGAQLFNAPVSSKPKKVQLTDFLTYQENSYVWAWISDKDCRVSVRISQSAADEYKRLAQRSIIDSRFSVVSISNYRPIFSPRPLGPNAIGNTPVSHLSLEIDRVKSIGVGGHLFGNPGDLESDTKMNEWVLGLRQDGGGGNVLKSRKQALIQSRQAAPLPPSSPPPFSLYARVSDRPAIELALETAKPKSNQPEDPKRAYTKRWRMVEVNPWKYATKPAAEERPHICPTSPLRTPSPTERQGTPTDWSSSNHGSPTALDKAAAIDLGDKPKVSTTAAHLPSSLKRHATVDTTMSSDAYSLQPPTPAQRIKGSPPHSPSHPRSSPMAIARSSPSPSQCNPVSSPPLPGSSLPLPSSVPTPVPMGIRKNIQRKVPHPGHTVTQPAPTKNGPAQVLVLNSDASGTGSSQSYSQSQSLPQSQQLQPSSLANSFKPPDSGKSSSPTRRTSKISAESSPSFLDAKEQESTHHGQKSCADNPHPNEVKQNGSDSTRPFLPSAPRTEVLEVGTSDTEEETEQLQLTRTTPRTLDGLDAQIRKQDKGRRDVDTVENNHLSIETPAVQSSPPRPPSPQLASSVIMIPHQTPINQITDTAPTHHQSPECRSVSQSSLYSLFSDPSEDGPGGSASPHAPVMDSKARVQEKTTAPHVPKHDPDIWKEPSFLARKGKGKAPVPEARNTHDVETRKKRRRLAESESPVPKRTKVTSEKWQVAPGQAERRQTISASAAESIRSGNSPSTSSMETTERTTSTTFRSSKPRLGNFVVDFEKIELGKKMPILVNIQSNIKYGSLRSGRIRELGQEVEEDGSIYIMRR